MSEATNCVWCPNGGHQPKHVGPICENCANDLRVELSEPSRSGGLSDD
jgi:hypothetical protein